MFGQGFEQVLPRRPTLGIALGIHRVLGKQGRHVDRLDADTRQIAQIVERQDFDHAHTRRHFAQVAAQRQIVPQRFQAGFGCHVVGSAYFFSSALKSIPKRRSRYVRTSGAIQKISIAFGSG